MTQQSDRITRIELGLHDVPLAFAVSDAKVLTGRQKPMAEVSVLGLTLSERAVGMRRDHVVLRAD